MYHAWCVAYCYLVQPPSDTNHVDGFVIKKQTWKREPKQGCQCKNDPSLNTIFGEHNATENAGMPYTEGNHNHSWLTCCQQSSTI